MCSDKKFNTLTKSLGVRKSPQFYSMRKCKRHHSYNGPNLGKSENKSISISQTKLTPNIIDFGQPLYENLTDSIQIYEATLPGYDGTDPNPALIRFNTNSNSYHDSDTNSSSNNTNSNNCTFNYNKDQLSYISSNKERMSIHRSDSGISNSSYECIPQPAPRSVPNSSKLENPNGNISSSNLPIYMNVPCLDNDIGHLNEMNVDEVPSNNNFYTRPTNFLPIEFTPKIERKESTSSNKSLRRPIKLPLRKHHSFHFQTSQTVAGLVRKKYYQQTNKTQHHKYTGEKNISPTPSTVNFNHCNNINEKPLNFKSFDESSAFKPIQPISQQLNQSMPNSTTLDSKNKIYNSNDRKLPRICGTSLKRQLIDVNTLETEKSQESSSHMVSKRLVYADLLDTDKNSASTVNNKVNCIPKPSRTQYATIQFPEVNI